MSPFATPTRYAEIAVDIRKNGYSPIPTKVGTKQPAIAWKPRCDALPSLATIERDLRYFGFGGAAIACGIVIAIDLDFTDAAMVSEAKCLVSAIAPGDPLERVGQFPKALLLYRAEEPVRTVHRRQFDILAQGSYFVGWGVHPVTKKPFEWIGSSPLDVPRVLLPLINARQIDQITVALEELSDRIARPVAPQPDVATGLIRDGRDVEMRRIVYDVWNKGIADPHELIEKSWLLFQERVDLRRPKRDGSEPWSKADVESKVASLLRRVAEGKVYRSASGGDMRYDAMFEPFMQAIYALTARRRLPNAAADLSFVMLCLCRNGGGCFASVSSLARQIKRSAIYVKKVRALLQREGLWVRRKRGAGRGNASEYYPCIDAAVAQAETVCFQGPYITSVGGTLQAEDPSKKPENNRIIENSISLLKLPEGGEA
ncbi:bifunctional DNA primase/polymerase [Sphingomonas crocodyli]|uniref:DNA primase/polymerase bifunctional N-terminal domain-containing protein n=1 Tax=Sphingomonas crocodyli TaxID=1979270 RepID=A0A437M7G5_9SPHN|nr:bifunctional DNA primase/polymerase [Sphingomonas crocodyli]RVT93434.1 hypothetical protein EOD43_06035 [Sphingomonas crocodyli]